jgi:hypothetical protein
LHLIEISYYFRAFLFLLQFIPSICVDGYRIALYSAMFWTAFHGFLRVGERTDSIHCHQLSSVLFDPSLPGYVCFFTVVMATRDFAFTHTY